MWMWSLPFSIFWKTYIWNKMQSNTMTEQFSLKWQKLLILVLVFVYYIKPKWLKKYQISENKHSNLPQTSTVKSSAELPCDSAQKLYNVLRKTNSSCFYFTFSQRFCLNKNHIMKKKISKLTCATNCHMKNETSSKLNLTNSCLYACYIPLNLPQSQVFCWTALWWKTCDVREISDSLSHLWARVPP